MEVETGAIVTKALLIVIEVLLPIMLVQGVRLLNEWISQVRLSKHAKAYDSAYGIIFALVQTAEQNGLRGAIENEAKAKKAWVLEQAEISLAKRGIKIDLDEIDALVESCVFEAFKKVELPKPTVEPAKAE